MRDQKTFNTHAYSKLVEKPWGYEIHWVPEDRPYMGKIIHVNAGKRLSLQAHDEKQESWTVLAGRAKVVWENTNGEMIETELEPGKGYSCALFQKHRLVGITDTDILEVSTPEKGTTFRYEDDFKRPDETEELRKKERNAA